MKKFWCNGKKDFCETTINCINCEYYSNLGGADNEVKEIKTNYDKITENEETLAEFLSDDWCPKGYRIICESKDCKECIKEWLQKECDV